MKIRIEPTKKQQEFIASDADILMFAGGAGSGKSFILMSSSGFNSLNTKQKETLSNFGSFITPEIPTIEYYGGGSVRCMIAEIN